MSQNMTGKTALVTGAAAGIGRATALAFAQRGARLVLADVDVERGEETAHLIHEAGGGAIFLKTDVSAESEVHALVQRIAEEYGDLDYAFNNAGIEGDMAPTQECSAKNWAKTITINLEGLFYCVKYEVQQMLDQGGGAIVNMASVAGLIGFAGLPAYAASKHGVLGITKTTALECAQQNIRINAVCPGVIATEMIERITENDEEKKAEFAGYQPMGRMGRPEEVATAVVWLCSDEASFITGHALAVDGGYVAQ